MQEEGEAPLAEDLDFCRPITAQDIERGWADEQAAQTAEPESVAPPIANVALALELAEGTNAIRAFPLAGREWRMRPTTFGQALRTIAWSQALERFEGMVRVDPALVEREHLPEMQECYIELAGVGFEALVEPVLENPFLQAEPDDFHRLIAFLLDPGDETPIPRQFNARPGERRWNAAHNLFAYLAAFGAVPGMVRLEEGCPTPASWRHFLQGSQWLRRDAAERALQMFGATAELEKVWRERWIAGQQREMGP